MNITLKNPMRSLKFRLIKKIRNFLASEMRDFKFLLGQAAITASRTQHSKLINLWDAEVKVYSQWGEDGILDFICETIGLAKPRVLEIGAGNFSECNSRFLAEFRNASVMAVDARADLMLTQLGSLKWKNHIELHNEWITPENINDIIDLAFKRFNRVDIFSLDLDGNDFWILEKANLASFKVIVLEYNALFGSKHEVTVPRDDKFDRRNKHFSGLYYGASLKAFVSLLRSKDFMFIGTNRSCVNAFFIKKNLHSKFHSLEMKDLGAYVDSTIRESRDSMGKLSFLDGSDRKSPIESLALWDLSAQKTIKVCDLT